MSNSTSNATIGLAIDPSSLISSCELGSMGGSAAAQRYIELRTPVALVGPAAFNLPDIVAASVARSHAAAREGDGAELDEERDEREAEGDVRRRVEVAQQHLRRLGAWPRL